MWPQLLSDLKQTMRVKKANTPWQFLQWLSSLQLEGLIVRRAGFEKRLDVQQGQSQDLDREEVGPWEVGWGYPGRNTWELRQPRPQDSLQLPESAVEAPSTTPQPYWKRVHLTQEPHHTILALFWPAPIPLLANHTMIRVKFQYNHLRNCWG